MLWLITQMWTLLILAFVIGAAAGVWVIAARKKRADVQGGLPGEPAPPSSLLDGPDGQKDDLTQIIGIDRQTEKRLNAIGVYHLRQIAGWNEGAARWIEIRLNEPGRVARERWSDQAASLG